MDDNDDDDVDDDEEQHMNFDLCDLYVDHAPTAMAVTFCTAPWHATVGAFCPVLFHKLHFVD